MGTYRGTILVSLLITLVPAVPADDPDTDQNLFFETKIRPVLVEHCSKCHSATITKPKGGLRLDSRDGILAGGDTGRAVVAGNVEQSRIIEAIRYENDHLRMPPAGKLSDAVIADFITWVQMGAPYPSNRGTAPPDRTGINFKKAREFWAFQKLKVPDVPPVERHDRLRTPVDAFILAKLEDVLLQFSPDADRRTLLRRVYLDLTGLTPTPEVVNNFLADKSTGAYQRVVDRLLASPHFGERWGQHWLDAAGFVPERGQQWQYRDYVIRSFNGDKPYDRFLVEQFAGDEMVDWRKAETFTPETKELLVATGFLRTANDQTGNVMTDIPSYRYAILFDTIEIFGTGVLGLTLQCARCHSHKYDPVSQQDYYRLMALFTPAYNPQKWIRVGERMLPEGIEGVYDVAKAPKTHLLIRGDFRNPGSEVSPGYLRVFCNSDSEALAPLVNSEAKGATSGRRLSFARWLTRPETPISGLIARVMINRIWQHLFGEGIVATPGNLGHSGARPTHPKLIDYLASEFVRDGMRVKRIIKMLVMSTVYRQRSTFSDSHTTAETVTSGPYSVDPHNQLLWRMSLRRLESEIIRDCVLAASSALDRTLAGPVVPLHSLPGGLTVVKTEGLPTPTSQWRRSVYLGTRRIGGSPQPSVTLLSVFDHPILNTNCTRRKSSAVVLQSLTMLNDVFVLNQADIFSDRVARESGPAAQDRIDLAFRIALARPPTAEEAAWSVQFLNEQRTAYRASLSSPEMADRKALASLCHALFNTNNFLYVE